MRTALLLATLLIALSASAHEITDIVFTPESPAAMGLDEQVTFTFNYDTDEPTGVRIFARPFTEGGLSPAYSAGGSLLYATGAGSGDSYFTITSGAVVVDQVRFRMLDADQTNLLLEFFVDVDFSFGIVGNETRTFSQVKKLFE